MNQVITVHVITTQKNYRCKVQTEIHSNYLKKKTKQNKKKKKTEVSLHVTLLYRHDILEVDGIERTVEKKF